MAKVEGSLIPFIYTFKRITKGELWDLVKLLMNFYFYHCNSSPGWTNCTSCSCEHVQRPNMHVHSELRETGWRNDTEDTDQSGPHLLQLYGSYLYLSDQDICDASQHSHKVKHIPRCFQVVLKDEADADIRLHREGSKSSDLLTWFLVCSLVFVSHDKTESNDLGLQLFSSLIIFFTNMYVHIHKTHKCWFSCIH